MKRRYKHSLSHYKLATFDMGELVPVGCVEVLPGDSFRHSASCLVRVSPLLAPVMHPIQVRLHHFFVPNRLLWKNWEDFITGGPDGEGGDATAVPTITTQDGFAEGTLADYLGCPTGVPNLTVSALPFRAYSLIFNEYYRDQDLVAELPVSDEDGNDTTTNVTLQRIAWEKDYFTAARPWPQKGPALTLPLGETAPVQPDGTRPTFRGDGTIGDSGFDYQAGQAIIMREAGNVGATENMLWGNPGLEADLTNATSATVAELRRVMALQRYQEARAMYGSEYVDYLRYAFGVRSSDARLQRPEYLGGGKQTISFSEVLQTGPDGSGEGVADLKGHGIAALRSRRYTRFFEEHGYVISLMSVRPRSMYGSGLHRSWFRATKEDYFQHELQFIGQQEVLNKEVYAAHSQPDGTFGWQDRYSEYRHLPSMVAGEFRSTLNFWHLARLFASDPALNSSFVQCNPGKRINASQATDQLWVMVNHSLRARRQVAPANPGRIF